MSHPIPDYRTFLIGAKQSITTLNELKQQESALSQQLRQSQRQFEAEEKAVQDHIAQFGMFFHNGKFFVCKPPRFVQDFIVNGNLPDIMKR